MISDDGNQLGVVPLSEALGTAKEAGLDLVEVAPQVSPPVCRIMDYGRYKYQQSKKLQEARKKSSMKLPSSCPAEVEMPVAAVS